VERGLRGGRKGKGLGGEHQLRKEALGFCDETPPGADYFKNNGKKGAGGGKKGEGGEGIGGRVRVENIEHHAI